MPNISFTVQDIGGHKMDPKEVEVIFEPNEALIGAVAPRAGFLYPTEPVIEKPDPETGEVSVLLADTSLMLGDAFYRLRIRWLGGDAGTALMDFPTWKIRPGADDALLSEVIDVAGGGGGGGIITPYIWWVGLTEPPSRGYTWLYLDPDNPDLETGPIPELTLGDVVVRW
ncbi:hypothetical protein ACT17S_07240 [Glutamicibacter mysorens]